MLFYICGHQITHAIPVFRLHTAFYIFVNTCSYHIGHTPCPIGRIGAACIVLFPDNIFSIGFRVLLLQAANGICPLGQLGKRGKFIIFPKSMPRRPLDRNIIITGIRDIKIWYPAKTNSSWPHRRNIIGIDFPQRLPHNTIGLFRAGPILICQICIIRLGAIVLHELKDILYILLKVCQLLFCLQWLIFAGIHRTSAGCRPRRVHSHQHIPLKTAGFCPPERFQMPFLYTSFIRIVTSIQVTNCLKILYGKGFAIQERPQQRQTAVRHIIVRSKNITKHARVHFPLYIGTVRCNCRCSFCLNVNAAGIQKSKSHEQQQK